MKSFRIGWMIVLVVSGGLALAQSPQQGPQRPQQGARQGPQAPQAMTPQRDFNATIKDIERTFGFVPAWMREISPAMLPGFWELMKTFEMGNTRLDMKTKQLIGLGVAAGVPCEYCIMFHTQAAKLHGASDQEIEEAVGMAATTRLGSTVLNGLQVDKNQFRRDLDRMVRHQRQQQARK